MKRHSKSVRENDKPKRMARDESLSMMNSTEVMSNHHHHNANTNIQKINVGSTIVELNDDNEFNESEDENDTRTWNLDEKLKSNAYNNQFLLYLNPKEFNLKYLQENGFKWPIVFKEKNGLGLVVPSEDFNVSDVKRCVGSKRIVDVMDVNTQKGLTMTMKEWCEYFENIDERQDRLLNVISLEFSHTKLERFVQAPTVVRQIDWIDNAWPQSLIASHTESTNVLDKMKYPKVQKYVLMSVAKSYTDFHIDMGGTSVWYHVVKGEKLFWLVPPTDENLKLYEKWLKSGKQNQQFFGDLVPGCQRVSLKQGYTFMLPSGWIHSVYTPKDSLVFGGNFLHSFNIPMQLKIYDIENKTRVPTKFRYPFYIEMIWYVIEKYVYRLTGHSYLAETINSSKLNTRVNLTSYEYEGLNCLYNFLKNLRLSRRQVPTNITKPDELLKRLKRVLNEHSKDIQTLAVTGEPIFKHQIDDRCLDMNDTQSEIKPVMKTQKENCTNDNTFNNRHQNNNEIQLTQINSNCKNKLNNSNEMNKYMNRSDNELRKLIMRKNASPLPVTSTATTTTSIAQRVKGPVKRRLRTSSRNIERRRRIRCRACVSCTRDDCGECKYCKDMKKFGGQGISKQCCLSKQCINPLLPSTTVCMFCEIQIDRYDNDTNTMMYECEICFEIYHAQCFWKKYPHLIDVESVVNEDLPSSWHCAKCRKNGLLDVDRSILNRNYYEIEDENYEDEYVDIDATSDEGNNSHVYLNANECYSDEAEIEKINSQKYSLEKEVDVYSCNNSNISISSSCYSSRHSSGSVHCKHNNHDIDNDESIISIDSLSNNEKQIILNEFCEVIRDDSCNNNDDEVISSNCQYGELEEFNRNISIKLFKNNHNFKYLNEDNINFNNWDYIDVTHYSSSSDSHHTRYSQFENSYDKDSEKIIKETKINLNYLREKFKVLFEDSSPKSLLINKDVDLSKNHNYDSDSNIEYKLEHNQVDKLSQFNNSFNEYDEDDNQFIYDYDDGDDDDAQSTSNQNKDILWKPCVNN